MTVLIILVSHGLLKYLEITIRKNTQLQNQVNSISQKIIDDVILRNIIFNHSCYYLLTN